MRTYELTPHTLIEQPTAVVTATLDVPEIGPWLGQVFGEVAAVLGPAGAGPVGPPFARYHEVGTGRFEVEAGFPARRDIERVGEVGPSLLPSGPAVVTTHVGPYDEMEPAHAAVSAWITEHGFEANGDAWEVYYSDPDTQPDPETWRTDVVAPYRER